MKRLLTILGGLVALVFTAVIVLAIWLLNFDANDNKDWIARKFQEETGRTLTLGGNIELSFYPWLGLTADDVAIGNASGFSDAPLLEAGQLAFRIKLLPLLRSRYEIDTVQVNGLRLNLEVAGNGRNNWSSLGSGNGADSTGTREATGNGGSSAILNNLIIGGVNVTDTSIVYDDAFADTHYEIANLDLSIGELVYGNPLDIRMELDAASRTPELSTHATLTGTVVYDMDNGRYDLAPLALRATLRGPGVPAGNAELTLDTALSMNVADDTLTLNDLVLSALGMRVTANVEAADLQGGKPAVSSTLEASGADLAVLFRVLQQDALADRISALDSSFSLLANVEADLAEGSLQVPVLQARLLNADINGRLAVSDFNTDEPAVNGELNAAGPDLPTLIEVVGMLQGGSAAPLSETGRKLSRVRDKAFRVATTFDADLGRGSIELPTLDASLLGFTAKAQLTANNLQSSNGTVSGTLQLQGNQLREVLAAFDQAALGDVAQSLQLDVAIGGTRNNLRLSPLQLDLVVAGRQIPNSPQTLSLSADTVADLDRYSLRSDGFSLSGLGLTLNGSVEATSLNAAPSFSGKLDVPAFNARRFLQQLNQPVPTTADDTVLQRVALSTAFGGSQSSVILNQLQLQLDDTAITGDVAVTDLATLATQFTLAVDSIDADRYLAPASDAADSTAAASTPLPQEQLQTLNVQGKLNIGALTLSGLHMRDIVMELNAANGVMALAPFRASLYEGSFDGDIRLDANGSVPAATVDTTLANVQLGPLLQDFMDAAYVSGSGNVRLSLAGSGADSAAIKRNLNGSGSIQLQDGVLQGVDVAAVLASIETMIRSRRTQQLPQGGSTAFDASAATLAIDNGVVTTNDLTVKAPGWALAGAGTLADLGNDSIDFNLLVSVDESTATSADTEYNLGGYTLPIACTGALDSPRCLPDARQILAALVGSAVQQRLGEFLQERLGGGTQQAPADDGSTDAQELQDTAPTTEEEQPDATQQLLNRALESLRRN